MTTIQNIQTPTIRFNANVIRKTASAAKGLAGAAALAAIALTVVVFASVVNVTAGTYFFVLVATIVAMAALGLRENANQAKKTQYDIR